MSFVQTSTSVDRQSTAIRFALALNALVAAVALAIKFGEVATTADPQFPSVFGRVANELCYFTIESNLIVLAVCVALAWRPERWRWMAGSPRLTGLVCITVTGVVYYTLLAADQHYVGIAVVGDVLAHAVSPLLFVGTWLLGRRGEFQRQHLALMLIFPVLWVGLTLVRGAIIHIYPYDFVDVKANGYVSVVITVVVMLAAARGLAALAVRVDGWRKQAALLDGPVRTLEPSLG
ncbi:MAG TPA: Pr6Pr family membrane protein [Ilumatobacteraceae bacterium]|nr:Pr6Pr family membrane protein [Ilumatobacteraceae bacterium]